MSFHDDSEDHEEQVNERWLVSYSDMMTLLFGLFVMLFSMASENQEHFQERLKSISQSSFDTHHEAADEPVLPPPVAVPVAPEVPRESEKTNLDKKDLSVENASLKQEKVALTQEKVTLSQEKLALNQEKTALQQERDQLADQIQKMLESEKQLQAASQSASAAAQMTKQKEQEIENLRKQIEQEKSTRSQSELAAATARDQLKNRLQAEEKKKAEETEKSKDLKRNIAQATEKQKSLVAETEKNEDRAKALESEKANLLKQKETLEAKNEDLSKKAEELEHKLDELQNQAKKDGQFMMIVLKWSSEKHDLDLTVTDPDGKVFNFKNRHFAGHPGDFTLDSRSGPGAEIWQTDKIIPGVYTVSWKLYNTYGNDNPVVYSGIISSNSNKIEIPESKLEAKVGAQKSLKIKVDATGKLSKL